MAVYDDKTSGIIKAGDGDNCFIISNVKSRTEAIFKASYIVASSMHVSGKITALFDLIVLGDVEADDIEVKGKFVCLGDCTVENSIIVQDKMFVKQVKAKNIEVHDQITAQEIDVDVIKADGNIIVGQTLATEELAFSGQNMLCGETVFGRGEVSAYKIITGEDPDLDFGEDAIINPNKIEFKKSNSLETLYSEEDVKNNNFLDYIDKLKKASNQILQKEMFSRWEKTLCEVEELLKNDVFPILDLKVLLVLREIVLSDYFKEWNLINEWYLEIATYFEKLMDGTLPLDNQIQTLENVRVGQKLKHAIDGECIVESVSKKHYVQGEILFDSGIKKEFKKDLLKKTTDEKEIRRINFFGGLELNQRIKDTTYGKGIVTKYNKSKSTLVSVVFANTQTKSYDLELAKYFFTIVQEPIMTAERIQAKLFLNVNSYVEWITYVNILHSSKKEFNKKLYSKVMDMLYAKIGVKSKFIEDRIKENGWDN